MTRTQLALLLARVTMEAGVIGALAYWGLASGGDPWSGIAFAVLAPAIGFGFWGVVDFRGVPRYGEALRLAQELAVSGVASVLLWTAGPHILAGLLAGLSVVYHAAVYLSGERLLGREAGAAPAG